MTGSRKKFSTGRVTAVGKTVSATDMLRAGRGTATRHLVPESSRRSDVEEAERLGTDPAGKPTATYQRTTIFLTPDHRRWLKDTVRGLPVDGLSVSEIVRLALNRLRADLEDTDELVQLLTTQAHEEAKTLTGRRNRGLPPHSVG
jgi:hypothetical protein